ncbi:MAG: glycosyltransferase family 2 protein [Pseudomonadota bacterium]
MSDRTLGKETHAQPNHSEAASPKISVITAVYNCEHTISETIESVARQDYDNVEHIVVDGMSTDRTREIAASYKSVDKIHSERDEGIYDAFNKGLAIASGDLIAFLNGDDYYASSDTLRLVATHHRDSGADIVMGNVAMFSDAQPQRPIVRYYNSGQFRPDRIAYGWMPAHPAMFVDRTVFERFGGFDKTYRIGGDFELVARHMVKGSARASHMDRTLVFMRTGGASTGGLGSNWVILKENLRACRANGIDTNIFKLGQKYLTKLSQFVRRPSDLEQTDASPWW